LSGPARGVDLFNRGLYWEAHEAWEEVWTIDRQGPDSGFYKGLIQVAAGCLHYRRRNRRGAVNKWRSGADYLRPYLPAHLGVDLVAVVDRIDEMRAALDADEAWPEWELPRLSQSGG
jgi:predicted metal-dependent hydrolase